MKELQHETAANDMITNKDVAKTPGKDTKVDDAAATTQLLTPEDRAETLAYLRHRITAAGARCNDAIQAVKIHTLLKKPDDMPWMVGMLLDVAFTALTTSAIRALTKFKAGKISEYGKAASDAAVFQDVAAHDVAEKRRAMFSAISDESIRARVGLVGGLAKNQGRSIVAMALADSQDKAATLSYLAQLQTSMDVAFQNLGERGTQGLTDPELMVFFDAMDASHHSSEIYERAITDKIARFKSSGVESIGKARTPNGVENARHEPIGALETERRVVWVEYPDKTRALWFYERSQSSSNAQAHEAAAADGHDGKLRLTRIVPKEFWDEAVARSEQEIGPTQLLDDSPTTRRMLGMPVHEPAKQGTIRTGVNKIFGGK